jgi:FdhE protein
VTQDIWLTEHPYLRSVAEFHAQVQKAVAGLPKVSARVPNWPDYVPDFLAGVPLLQSSSGAIDLKPVEVLVESLVERLALRPIPEKLGHEVQNLDAEFRRDSHASERAVAWLLDRGVCDSKHLGLLRHVGWTVLARYLSRVVAVFESWFEERRWFRSYCPTCGSLPAMACLVGIDPGRARFLCCGCCGTQWRFRRTGCPFCKVEDDHRLLAVALEGEHGLRIDYCECCRGYLKTYDGTGSESLLLADWTSLHLDVIARDRGLKRLAASLYEL